MLGQKLEAVSRRFFGSIRSLVHEVRGRIRYFFGPKTLRTISEKIGLALLLILSVVPIGATAGKVIFHSNVQALYSGTKVFSEASTWNRGTLGYSNAASLWRYSSTETIVYALSTAGIPLNYLIQILLIPFALVSFFYCVKLLRLPSFTHLDLKSSALCAFLYTSNLYTLTGLGGDYTLLLPHYALPLLLYLGLKYINGAKPFLIYFGIASIPVFGVNLVFNVILFVALVLVYVLYSRAISIKKAIPRIAALGALTTALHLWWLIPMFYVNLTHAVNAVSVLMSENFYNDNSLVLHVLRGLGSWSFFASHKGVPYREFAYMYKKGIVMWASFFVPFLFSAYVLFLKKITTNKREYYRYLLLASSYIFLVALIVGTNPDLVTSNILKWFFANVPFAQIFRNTYKWGSLLILVCAMILARLLARIHHQGAGKYFVYGVWAMLVISVYPIFTGTVFDSKRMVQQIPKYWYGMAEYINGSTDQYSSRIFQLPNQYFTVFNWEGEMKALPGNIGQSLFNPPSVYNTCVGCGINTSLDWIGFLYKNVGNKKLNQLLSLSGIDLILQRNDFFLGYYNSQSPETVQKILKRYNGIRLEKKIGELDLYRIGEPTSIVYSPERIAGLNNFSDSLDLLRYEDIDAEKDGLLFLAQNASSSVVLPYSYYALTSSPEYMSMHASSVVSLLSVPKDSVYELVNRISTSTVVIDPKRYSLTSDAGSVIAQVNGKYALNRGEYILQQEVSGSRIIYSEDFSAATSSWLMVRDCDKRKSGAVLSAVFDVQNENTALKISSDKNMACVISPSFKTETNSYYQLNLTVQSLNGSAGFCLWNGFQCVLRRVDQGSDAISSGIRTISVPFKTDETTRSLRIYLYAPAQLSASEARYDSISISRLEGLVGDYYVQEREGAEIEAVKNLRITPKSSTLYEVSLRARKGFVLIFRESFHPKWLLRSTDGGKALSFLPNGDSKKSVEDHFIANGYANAWYIDTDDWCATQGKCTKNADGSYDIEMVIEFWPQRWFYLGLLISGTTLAGCLGYLGYEGVRSVRRRWVNRKKE